MAERTLLTTMLMPIMILRPPLGNFIPDKRMYQFMPNNTTFNKFIPDHLPVTILLLAVIHF